MRNLVVAHWRWKDVANARGVNLHNQGHRLDDREGHCGVGVGVVDFVLTFEDQVGQAIDHMAADLHRSLAHGLVGNGALVNRAIEALIRVQDLNEKGKNCEQDLSDARTAPSL